MLPTSLLTVGMINDEPAVATHASTGGDYRSGAVSPTLTTTVTMMVNMGNGHRNGGHSNNTTGSSSVHNDTLPTSNGRTKTKSVAIVAPQRSNSLDYLNFEERRQLIASSLSLSDFLQSAACNGANGNTVNNNQKETNGVAAVYVNSGKLNNLQ